MRSAEGVINKVEQHCIERGIRLTSKRKLVLSLLLDSDRALSAYDLVGRIKTEYGLVLSAMSMYRILVFLVQKDLAHKLKIANKYVACTHIGCDQEHGVSQFLICEKCFKVNELTLAPSLISDLKHSTSGTGFVLEKPQIEMNCLCEDCRRSVS